MIKRYIKCFLPLGLLLLASASFAATTFVSFGPTNAYTSTGNQALRDSSLLAWSGGATPTVPFSSSLPLSPAIGWSGTSGVFYGGFSGVVTGTTGMSRFAAGLDNAATDRVRIGITAGTGNTINSFTGVVYWDKADFLNGGSSAIISLDGSSSLSLNVPAGSNLRGRWVIRDGDKYYVSNGTTNFITNSSGSFSLSGAALMATNWDEYTPATSLAWTSNPDTTRASSSFTNVTGVGFYFLHSNPVSGQNFNITFDSFSFSGVASASLTALESWRQVNFGSSVNAGNGADSADPDSDGLVNLLEYALGTDPNVPSATPLVVGTVATSGSSYLTLTFSRARSDMTYIVEGSSDLSTWSVIANNPGVVGQAATVVDTVSFNTQGRRFLRLKVTYP